MPSEEELKQWAQQFYEEHQRTPTQDDYREKQWGDQFVATYGRAPTQADWEARWYAQHGGRPGTVRASGGRASASGTSATTVGELLGDLNFPKFKEQVPSMLRDFMRYLEELTKSATPPPVPFQLPDEGDAEEQPTLTEFYQKQNELAGRLGLDLAAMAKEEPAQQWQRFVDAIKGVNKLEDQQALLGLRWAPETGWQSASTNMLPNLRYL